MHAAVSAKRLPVECGSTKYGKCGKSAADLEAEITGGAWKRAATPQMKSLTEINVNDETNVENSVSLGVRAAEGGISEGQCDCLF